MLVPTIVDKVSEILDLYDTSCTDNRREEKLRRMLKGDGVIGINSKTAIEAKEYIKAMLDYLRNHAGELAEERAFLEEIVGKGIISEAEIGVERALSVFSKRDFDTPTVELVVDYLNQESGSSVARFRGKGENQCMYSASIINLAEVHNEFRNLDFSEKIRLSRKRIESLIAHETNHSFLDEMIQSFSECKVHWLYHQAFYEGLATFVETWHYPQHFVYIKDINTWLGFLSRVAALDDGLASFPLIPNDEHNEPLFLELLQEISENPSFIEHCSGTDNVKEVRDIVARRKKFDCYDDLKKYSLYMIFLCGNGPIYHIGCYMWQKIYDVLGIDKVKELTIQGEGAFLKAYERACLLQEKRKA